MPDSLDVRLYSRSDAAQASTARALPDVTTAVYRCLPVLAVTASAGCHCQYCLSLLALSCLVLMALRRQLAGPFAGPPTASHIFIFSYTAVTTGRMDIHGANCGAVVGQPAARRLAAQYLLPRAGGDVEKAMEWLKKKGMAKADKKAAFH